MSFHLPPGACERLNISLLTDVPMEIPTNLLGLPCSCVTYEVKVSPIRTGIEP